MLDVTSCSGGPPNGTYVLTSEGIEQHFAVQVLSRFVLGYALAVDANSVVKKGVMTVMKPAFKWSAFDRDDIDLKKAKDKGSYGMLACGSRDSLVMDTFIEAGVALLYYYLSRTLTSPC
jgi:hypothetical protein